MNNNTKYKIIAFICLIAVLGLFTHCISDPIKSRSASSSDSSSATPAPSPEQIINELQVSTGVRNHEQLLYTFSSLTGVSAKDSAIMTIYNQVASTLPTTNDIKVLLPPNQVALIKLAAEFCDRLVESPTLRQVIWPTLNLDTLSLNNFNNAAQLVIFDGIVSNFWGGEAMLSGSELQMAEDATIQLISDLAVGEANNAAATKKIVKGVCTSALSSAYVTLL